MMKIALAKTAPAPIHRKNSDLEPGTDHFVRIWTNWASTLENIFEKNIIHNNTFWSLKLSWLGVVKARWSHTLSKLKAGHPEQFGRGPGPQIDDPGTKIYELSKRLRHMPPTLLMSEQCGHLGSFWIRKPCFQTICLKYAKNVFFELSAHHYAGRRRVWRPRGFAFMI